MKDMRRFCGVAAGKIIVEEDEALLSRRWREHGRGPVGGSKS